METLIAKFREFRRGFYDAHREVYRDLAKSGQSPHSLVIACSDSRVLPETLFNAGPGEIFVIRNVANLVPPYAPDDEYHGTSAALEFAVRALRVERVVVLGHSFCGGVKALLSDGARQFDFLGQWVRLGEPALRRVREHQCKTEAEEQHQCELEVVRTSIANLMTFPWVAERVAEGNLAVIGCHFDFETGDLLVLDHHGGEFRAVAPDPA